MRIKRWFPNVSKCFDASIQLAKNSRKTLETSSFSRFGNIIGTFWNYVWNGPEWNITVVVVIGARNILFDHVTSCMLCKTGDRINFNIILNVDNDTDIIYCPGITEQEHLYVICSLRSVRSQRKYEVKMAQMRSYGYKKLLELICFLRKRLISPKFWQFLPKFNLSYIVWSLRSYRW